MKLSFILVLLASFAAAQRRANIFGQLHTAQTFEGDAEVIRQPRRSDIPGQLRTAQVFEGGAIRQPRRANIQGQLHTAQALGDVVASGPLPQLRRANILNQLPQLRNTGSPQTPMPVTSGATFPQRQERRAELFTQLRNTPMSLTTPNRQQRRADLEILSQLRNRGMTSLPQRQERRASMLFDIDEEDLTSPATATLGPSRQQWRTSLNQPPLAYLSQMRGSAAMPLRQPRRAELLEQLPQLRTRTSPQRVERAHVLQNTGTPMPVAAGATFPQRQQRTADLEILSQLRNRGMTSFPQRHERRASMLFDFNEGDLASPATPARAQPTRRAYLNKPRRANLLPRRAEMLKKTALVRQLRRADMGEPMDMNWQPGAYKASTVAPQEIRIGRAGLGEKLKGLAGIGNAIDKEALGHALIGKHLHSALEVHGDVDELTQIGSMSFGPIVRTTFENEFEFKGMGTGGIKDKLGIISLDQTMQIPRDIPATWGDAMNGNIFSGTGQIGGKQYCDSTTSQQCQNGLPCREPHVQCETPQRCLCL